MNDPKRIAIAFDRIAGEVTTWPAPKQVLDLLPDKPREYFHKLPAPEMTPEEIEADKVRRRAITQAASEELGIPLKLPEEPLEESSPRPRMTLEQTKAAVEALRRQLDQEGA